MIDELTNETRADLAEAAVETFAEAARNDTREEALRDLLADMLHLCDRYGLDQRETVDGAFSVYDDEVADEDGDTAAEDLERANELLKHPEPSTTEKVPAEQLTLSDRIVTTNGVRRVLALKVLGGEGRGTSTSTRIEVEVQDAGSPTGSTLFYYAQKYDVTIASREE